MTLPAPTKTSQVSTSLLIISGMALEVLSSIGNSYKTRKQNAVFTPIIHRAHNTHLLVCLKTGRKGEECVMQRQKGEIDKENKSFVDESAKVPMKPLTKELVFVSGETS